MIWIYRILFLPVFALSIPYFLWHMKRRGGYKEGLNQKFGDIFDHGKIKPGRKRIWIQAVSVGEMKALNPLILRLFEDPEFETILTTNTSTGYSIAKQIYGDLVEGVYYFPIDFAPFNRKAWNRIQPDLCLLMEGELWPEHIHRAQRRKIPIVLINARLSDSTYRLYRRLGRTTRHLFNSLSQVIASSQNNAERFQKLGCDPENISSVGNLKCDVPLPTPLSDNETESLIQQLGLNDPDSSNGQPLIVCGASTWKGEESVLLRILEQLTEEGLHLRMLIVPRHMERREEIKSQVRKQKLSIHFRSEGNAKAPVQASIGDTTGELTTFLQISDIVFIGRSLPPHTGGQTPIEAGMLGKPVLFGPGMSNFRDIATSLLAYGVAERVDSESALKNAIRELCHKKDLRLEYSEKSKQWLKVNQGATDRTMEAIKSIL